MSNRSRRQFQCSDPTCDSRRFHVGGDGFTYCDAGHQQLELGAVVAEDTGEFVSLGRVSRRKDFDAESTTSTISTLRGTNAYEQYLLCLQLILRKHIAWLAKFYSLAPEFESIVRDLWTLKAQLMQGVGDADSGTETDARSTEMFSSQSEGEQSTATSMSQRSSRLGGSRNRRGPRLLDLFALLYVGTLLLRLPLSVADFFRLIEDGKLTYHMAAANAVPPEMLRLLPESYQTRLEPLGMLKPSRLQQSVQQFLIDINHSIGMAIPSINHTLLLFRWIQALFMPLEVYIVTKRLARLYDVGFAWVSDPHPLGWGLLQLPEVKLMILLVISTKILFPQGTTSQRPRDQSSLFALNFDWEVWSAERSKQIEQTKEKDASNMGFKSAFAMDERHAMELNDRELDQYLTWCEENLTRGEVPLRKSSREPAEFRQALFDFFPLPEQGHRSSNIANLHDVRDEGFDEHLFETQRALRPRQSHRSKSSKETNLAGVDYQRFPSVDALSGPYQAFHEAAAELVGCSTHDLVKAVYDLERRLLNDSNGRSFI